MEPTQILKKYFGYDRFRKGQESIINAILQGQDAFAIMPTGAGKSLCFQIPALILEGITIVISPLISLMQDQVGQLTQVGIPAAYINSSLTDAQIRTVITRAAGGAYRIIYVAPERLDTYEFIEFAQFANIAMVAVDEAHCVSHWGQDFRPSYLNIANFIAQLTTRPVVSAFTATATDLVREDIIKILGLHSPKIRATGFNRENLFFDVRTPANKFDTLLAYINQGEDKSGIIYCATRKMVDDVTSKLQSAGVPAASYHAGMAQDMRTQNQQDFVYDRVRVMVATNAFGMGIDKSNVSFVIHYNMPKNLENYYQEAGRAGRDGAPADCILLFSRQDILINQFLIDRSEELVADPEIKAREYRRLREMEGYCTTTNCLRQYILDYFNDTDPCECDHCSNCNNTNEAVDITIDAQKILSCIYRMEGRFGMATVIDVLKGSQSKKVMGAGLNTIKTYGIMADKPPELIREIAQYLTQEGYIKTIGDRYPVVNTTDLAWEILKQGKTLTLQLHGQYTDKKARHTKATTCGKYAVNQTLFDALKAIRTAQAEKEQVPAFVIFADAALYSMCEILPTTEDAFLTVLGVGEVKLKKYGKIFTEEIAKHKGDAPLKENAPEAPTLAQLVASFEIVPEPIPWRDFMNNANMLLVQIRGRGTSVATINKYLVADGYLTQEKAPTDKGLTLGIIQREEEGPEGEKYLRNYFNEAAQRQMLRYVVDIAQG